MPPPFLIPSDKLMGSIASQQRLFVLCGRNHCPVVFFEYVETWPVPIHRFGGTADERCENAEDANPSHGRPP
jgi:hypothetical protein